MQNTHKFNILEKSSNCIFWSVINWTLWVFGPRSTILSNLLHFGWKSHPPLPLVITDIYVFKIILNFRSVLGSGTRRRRPSSARTWSTPAWSWTWPRTSTSRRSSRVYICPNFSDNKGLQNSPVILSNGGSARGAALLRAVWRGRDAGSGTAHPRSTRPRGGQPCTSWPQ